MKKRSKKGFTLIELIVVIAILAILAAIAIPRLAGFTESARIANDKEAVALVANAAAMYYASNPNMASGSIALTTLSDNKLLLADDYTLKSNTYKGGSISVTLDSNGSITATIGSGGTAYSVTK